jgi:hypothetical protein
MTVITFTPLSIPALSSCGATVTLVLLGPWTCFSYVSKSKSSRSLVDSFLRTEETPLLCWEESGCLDPLLWLEVDKNFGIKREMSRRRLGREAHMTAILISTPDHVPVASLSQVRSEDLETS